MKAKTKKVNLFKLRKETNEYKRDKLKRLTWEFKDSCSQELLKIVTLFVQETRTWIQSSLKTTFREKRLLLNMFPLYTVQTMASNTSSRLFLTL